MPSSYSTSRQVHACNNANNSSCTKLDHAHGTGLSPRVTTVYLLVDRDSPDGPLSLIDPAS